MIGLLSAPLVTSVTYLALVVYLDTFVHIFSLRSVYNDSLVWISTKDKLLIAVTDSVNCSAHWLLHKPAGGRKQGRSFT